MSKWIRAEIRFSNKLMMYVLNSRDLAGGSFPDVFFGEREDESYAALVEKEARDLIARMYPQLAEGLSILGIQFDLSRRCWEFVAHHHSFPIVPMGERIPETKIEFGWRDSDMPINVEEET